MIAAAAALDTRATIGLNAAALEISVNKKTVRGVFEKTCPINLQDDVSF